MAKTKKKKRLKIFPASQGSLISVCFLVLVLAAVLVYAFMSGKKEIKPKISNITLCHAPDKQVEEVEFPKRMRRSEFIIRRDNDSSKGGDVHSRIIAFSFAQDVKVAGVSPDVLSVKFDDDAEIIGVLVSIEFIKNLPTFELAATINSTYGYESNLPQINRIKPYDTLIHVSWNGGPPNHVDEQIWYGKGSGFEVDSKDRIVFGAWMDNNLSITYKVWPEIIIYYRWL